MAKILESIKGLWVKVKNVKLDDVKNAPTNIWNWFWNLNRSGKIALGIFIAILIAIPVLFFNKAEEEKTETVAVRQVELVNVGEISNITSPLSLVGTVESVSEATVRAESSGQLTRVYKKLGDRVYAGEIIAQFENAGERAAVLQAEGALEQAKSGRDINLNTLNNSTAGNSLESAKQNTVNIFSSTLSTMEDVIRVKTDTSFNNPDRQELSFNVLVPDQILIGNIENKRREIEKMLIARSSKNQTINVGSNLEAELEVLTGELNLLKSYLDDLARAYNNSIPNQIYTQSQLDGNKAVIAGARAQISGSISGVLAINQALVQARAGNEINTGVKNPSLASSDATVKIAQGSYYAALARLSKTIVRSPITGTINSLDLKTGDYVTPSQQVAVVSNNGALEVTTYISSEDAKRVTVGQEVVLNQNIQAVVTRVASAIDSSTRKIQVKIGIKNNDKTLVNGTSVKVEIKGLDLAKNANQVKVINPAGPIKVFLSSVKITPRGNNIFIVNASNTLESVNVELGRILGEMIEIKNGVTVDMEIVKDARGLKEGNVVEIKE
jgi:multidrug efflux pump subunit AcrA (membrane-fusion protein)